MSFATFEKPWTLIHEMQKASPGNGYQMGTCSLHNRIGSDEILQLLNEGATTPSSHYSYQGEQKDPPRSRGRDESDQPLTCIHSCCKNRCMSTKEKETKSLSIRFPIHILEQMKELAKGHNRSLSGEVLTAMEEHLKRNQKGK